MNGTVKVTVEGETFSLLPKVFSTGSKGFSTSTKVVLEGKRYQVIMHMVEIGSKPK